jgi:predicted phage terminase large subunit-like protein
VIGSEKVWAEAAAKRSRFSGLIETLPLDQSPASAIVARASKLGRAGLEALFGSMTDDEVVALLFDLDFWARRQQVPPDTLWTWCVMLAGRGFGKTWAGARWAITKAREARSIGALIGPTAADVRDTMIRGQSGILALSPPWFMPIYEPSKRRVTWPNGIYAVCYSADKPDRLRGPNTGWVWGDEPATWKHEMAAVKQIPLFNRIGTKQRPPQTLLTGTPRPLKALVELLFEADSKGNITKKLKSDVVLRTGSSLANRANLAPSSVREFENLRKTRWGKQEVDGDLLLDVPGALFGTAKWVPEDADPHEIARGMDRRIVSIDPAPTSETGSDESGIMVQGVKRLPTQVGSKIELLKHAFVLEDLSERSSPREWARKSITAYVEYRCDAIVAECNTGGELVEQLLTSVAREMGVEINVQLVRAREAKSKRAEPVAALAESGRVHLVGSLPKLKNQLEKFTGEPGRRDDRVDAMNWGIHELVLGDEFFWA